MIGNKGNSSSNDENINSITIPEICPYCDEKLPSPLPNKLKDLFMNFQGKREYRDKGKNKINSPMSLMSRIESFQPGYYGPRGAIVIAETLRKLFIDTKILTKSLTIPQTPMEYLQEVLIPEAAVRLIQEDKDITAEKAREIMLESVRFGEYVHNDENQEM
ncbi:unnamed protein product [Rhizophagus irregularis]|uniref:Restriction of telomere capping protein 4 n=1 Tax=Rhizophagus irregularis TaxID=588596 RepID=A0A916E2T4_9GLOM|nr:unnamed protein product [Rhizophagus irregularis]